MKQKELLIISVGVFLTIVAWVVIELYKVRSVELIQQDIELPTVKRYEIDTEIIEKLRVKEP